MLKRRSSDLWEGIAMVPPLKLGAHRTMMTAGIQLKGRHDMRFAAYDGNLNGSVFIDFCRRLLHDTSGPVFLILDGHPVHRSKAVKQFAASTGGRLRLFFLPGYSPELNPD